MKEKWDAMLLTLLSGEVGFENVRGIYVKMKKRKDKIKNIKNVLRTN